MSEYFIIGGGPSLSCFNFDLLRDRQTIGCNSAFRLGPDICKVCFFFDMGWFKKNVFHLQAYHEKGGRVITHNTRKALNGHDWVGVFPRGARYGLSPSSIAHGGNSGCSAVNLALLMGARTIYLLGFDCKATGDKTHWHSWQNYKPHNPKVYFHFLQAWEQISKSVSQYVDLKIINLGPDSAIPYFPKQDWREVLL